MAGVRLIRVNASHLGCLLVVMFASPLPLMFPVQRSAHECGVFSFASLTTVSFDEAESFRDQSTCVIKTRIDETVKNDLKHRRNLKNQYALMVPITRTSLNSVFDTFVSQ